MANEAPVAPVSPASAPAPAAPATPAKPVTPPIPAAQAASMKPAPAAAAKMKAQPGDDLRTNLKKVSAEVFGSKDADVVDAAARAAKNPGSETPAPEAPAKVEAAPEAKKSEAPATSAAESKDRFADIAPPDGATEVTQKGWKALKEKANAEIAAAEKKLADAQAQIDTYTKATPADTAKLTKLEADLKAAQDKLAVYDVSHHPDFQRQYVEPQKKALSEADQLVKDNGIEGPSVESLLTLTRPEFAKAVSELAKDMPAFDQSTFVTNMREAYRIAGEQKNALAQAGELRAQLQSQAAAKQKTAFEATMKDFEGKMQPLAVPEKATAEEKAEIEQYNAGIATIRAAAEKNAFGRLDERGVAELASKAAATDFLVKYGLPRMERRYAQAVQLIKEQAAELDAIRAAKSPGTFSGDSAPTARDMSKGTFSDAMAEAKRAAAAGRSL